MQGVLGDEITDNTHVVPEGYNTPMQNEWFEWSLVKGNSTCGVEGAPRSADPILNSSCEPILSKFTQ